MFKLIRKLAIATTVDAAPVALKSPSEMKMNGTSITKDQYFSTKYLLIFRNYVILLTTGILCFHGRIHDFRDS